MYNLAYELGMMISISSNGSRLSNPRILELLTSRRPYRLTLSVYGASAASYDGLTRRRGSFAKFARGLAAAHEASLPINLNLIVARQNAHELDQMRAMAERFGLPYHVFSNISPPSQISTKRSSSPIAANAAGTPSRACQPTASPQPIITAHPATALIMSAPLRPSNTAEEAIGRDRN